MWVLECSIGGEPVPDFIIKTVAYIIEFIRIGVPLLLVIFGMVDLAKAVVAKEDKDMKKYQMLFLRKLLAGALVFFVISVTTFMLRVIDSAETDGRSTDDYEALECIQEILDEQ